MDQGLEATVARVIHTGGQVEPSAQLKAVPIVYNPPGAGLSHHASGHYLLGRGRPLWELSSLFELNDPDEELLTTSEAKKTVRAVWRVSD